MANRYFKQFRQSLETAIVDLFARLDIGAAGAVEATSKQVGLSVARTGAGTYLVTLEDYFYELKTCNVTFEGEALGYYIDNVNLSAKTFEIVVVDDAFVAADPTSGTKVRVQIILKNSSVAI